MDSHGYKTHVENGIMKIVKGALILMKAEKIGANLFMLKGETLQEADACVASNGEESTMMWHLKLGHMSEKRSVVRSKCILDLIHSDVWESSDISMGGAKYMVTFIDDYSRRCWVYPIKKKSDVFPVFKEYKARVELESGKKIKYLRTDNGGEYTDGEFLVFCKQEGIQRQFTVAYTPQQNGVAKRMNRTLTERIRAMLRTAGIPNSFWAEVAKTACYIVNRSPSTKIGLKTAMEMWTGKPTDYSYLHAFGCPVYVMYNAQERTKLDAKSRRCIFLGYADGVKAPEHEEQEPVESEAPEVRRSTHERRPSAWHLEYVTEINVVYCLLTGDGEPSTFHETLESSDVTLWMTAMQEEIEALHKNKTWELVPLPHGRKAIGNKWVYKIKRDGNDQVERYRARLVVKGYAQKEGIDFNEIFSPVVRLTTVRVVLAIPDIAQAVGTVSRYMTNPGGEHWIAVKRILRYIRGTSDVALCYGRSEFTVRGYVDSDFAGDLDKRKSTTGYVFALAGATVSWVSKLQTVVALSTTEAEYMAATQACKEAIWIQRLLEELRHKQQKIPVFCDSQSALHISRNPAFHSMTKHIGVKYHFVREVVEDGSMDL
ncbi:Integrase catalytic domain-containing protein [Citrus sinensis]|uniref:Integrase catalytic domain-containing protein n=1 Tax=Citrus sinensis TaxID=2711 RepID=A0ACB8KBU5_CITSI|nr:Integrase catalytic domain-containing protein [Citrus sinensis]